jgi:hypothetical protein
MIQEAAGIGAIWEALMCIRLQHLFFVLNEISSSSSPSLRPPIVTRISEWLPYITGKRKAKKYIGNWCKTRKIYATQEDLIFWQQLLKQLQDQPSIQNRFSIVLMRFLHTESDHIAMVWESIEARHNLWREICMSDCRLNVIILHVGQRLQVHQSRSLPSPSSSPPPSSPVFNEEAQKIFQKMINHEKEEHIVEAQQDAMDFNEEKEEDEYHQDDRDETIAIDFLVQAARENHSREERKEEEEMKQHTTSRNDNPTHLRHSTRIAHSTSATGKSLISSHANAFNAPFFSQT